MMLIERKWSASMDWATRLTGYVGGSASKSVNEAKISKVTAKLTTIWTGYFGMRNMESVETQLSFFGRASPE